MSESEKEMRVELEDKIKRRGAVIMTPVKKIPAYAVIIRAIHCRGHLQTEALTELDRRGLWLAEHQKIAAGLACGLPRQPSAEEDEYNRDLKLRIRDGQVGSGMKHR
jgi:phage terminase large subunit GpA-like protein